MRLLPDRRILAIALAAALFGTAAQGQTITFTKPAGAPDGIAVRVLTSDEDTTPADVDSITGGWQYKVTPEAGAWRNQPTFLIELPARTVEANHISSDKTIVELSFSFKATQTDMEVEVPIAMFTGVGVNDRLRVADMRPFQLFEKILMSQAMALHYLARIPEPNSSQARFTAKVWFDTIAAGVQNQDRPIRLSAGLDQTIGKVFETDAQSMSYFRGTAEQLRARAWRDYRDVDEALAMGCDTAIALLKFLDAHNAAFPGDAEIMGNRTPDDVLAQMRATITGHGCTIP